MRKYELLALGLIILFVSLDGCGGGGGTPAQSKVEKVTVQGQLDLSGLNVGSDWNVLSSMGVANVQADGAFSSTIAKGETQAILLSNQAGLLFTSLATNDQTVSLSAKTTASSLILLGTYYPLDDRSKVQQMLDAIGSLAETKVLANVIQNAVKNGNPILPNPSKEFIDAFLAAVRAAYDKIPGLKGNYIQTAQIRLSQANDPVIIQPSENSGVKVELAQWNPTTYTATVRVTNDKRRYVECYRIFTVRQTGQSSGEEFNPVVSLAPNDFVLLNLLISHFSNTATFDVNLRQYSAVWLKCYGTTWALPFTNRGFSTQEEVDKYNHTARLTYGEYVFTRTVMAVIPTEILKHASDLVKDLLNGFLTAALSCSDLDLSDIPSLLVCANDLASNIVGDEGVIKAIFWKAGEYIIDDQAKELAKKIGYLTTAVSLAIEVPQHLYELATAKPVMFFHIYTDAPLSQPANISVFN